jgi:hypothetical protein
VAIACNKDVIGAYNKALASVVNSIAVPIVAYLKRELNKPAVLSFAFVYSAINKTYKL